jgi:polyisoprenoid-binding protein YceI
MKSCKALVFAGSLLVATLAQAAEYTGVDAGKSALRFVYKQMGVAVDGRFAKFTVQLRFDPAKPQSGSAAFELDLASIDAGSPEANEEVAGKLWFNTAQFPKAVFTASTIKSLGANRYEIRGPLRIKGRTHEVAATFTFINGVADGAFTLKRGDFAIGEGLWADYGTVANEIQITFRIHALPGK